MLKANKFLQIGFGLLMGGLQITAKAGAPAMQLKDLGLIDDMAVAQDGSVWLKSSHFASKVLRHLNSDGVLIKQFSLLPIKGRYDGEITNFAVAPDGTVWVIYVDNLNFVTTPWILHYATDGALISQFRMLADYTLSYNPGFDLTIANDGSVWVADTSHHRVQHYAADGSIITQFGIPGANAGESTLPSHIAVAKDGSVWVTDGVTNSGHGRIFATNYRLKHYGADGKLITQFGSQGTANGQFNSIADLAVAADGSLWVADNNAFHHYQADGTFIEKIDSYGLGTSPAIASKVKMAPDGSSFWTVGSSSFLRHVSADGSIISQFKNRGLCSAEYDDIQQRVYLWNVGVGKQFFDAVLQYQDGRYNLLSAIENTPHDLHFGTTGCNISFYYSPINFDPSLNTLTIPSVPVIDKDYQARFTYLGNNSFELQTAKPLN